MAKHSKHTGKEDHLKSFLMSLYRDLKKGFDNPNPRWIGKKNMRVAALEPRLHPLVVAYLGQWKEQMDTAITDARLPEEKSRFYWFMALAGNLLWAATCFIPVGAAVSGARVLEVAALNELNKFSDAFAKAKEAILSVETSASAQRVIQAMSVGGAILGSGFGEQFMGVPRPAPKTIRVKVDDLTEEVPATGNPETDGKAVLRVVLALKEGTLETVFKQRERQWALEIDALAQWGDDVKEILDSYLWTHMFPRIPYDMKKLATIYLLAAKNVNGALEDFNSQWKEWQFRKQHSGPEYKNVRMRGDVWDYSVPDPGAFQPKLTFDLLA
jgi:hypothetical protein